MEIIFEEIHRKDISKFRDLAPREILGKSHDNGVHTVVAEVETPGGSQRAGMLQYTEEGDVLKITWLYVLSGQRNQGVGTYLTDLLTKKDQDMRRVYVELSDYRMTDMEVDEVAAFFAGRGFFEKESKEGIFCISGKDMLLKGPRLSEKNAALLLKPIVAFNSCTPDMLMNAAKRLGVSDTAQILRADKRMSFLMETSSGVKGLICSEKAGKTIFPTELIAHDEKIKEILLRAFFYGLRKNMRFDDRLITDGGVIDQAILEKLFNGIV